MIEVALRIIWRIEKLFNKQSETIIHRQKKLH